MFGVNVSTNTIALTQGGTIKILTFYSKQQRSHCTMVWVDEESTRPTHI